MKRWIMGSGGIVLLAFWCLFFPPPLQAADTLRVGIVDLQRILAESKAGKQAKDKVEAERNLKQKELTAREEEVSKLQRDFEKQASLLSETARKEKQEAIDRRIRDLRRTYDDFTRELEKKEAELVRGLIKDVSGIVRDYAKQKGYTLVFEKSQPAILYSAEEIDLTKEIIAQYDSKSK